MKCSIVIRTYNEEKHIGKLIEGINKQEIGENLKLEIIIVDSGSSDSTTSIARQMGARVVNISKENFSFGRALNIGCNCASGDILLFASAHVYPIYTDWIAKMMEPFVQENVGLVYGRQIGCSTSYFSEIQIFSKWFPEYSDYNQTTPFCNNANCAIRKSLWDDLKYDEELTGLEDLAWASNIMKLQFRVVYLSEAVIVHVHEETPQKIKNRYRREAIALKIIYPNLHFTVIDFVQLFVRNVITDFYRAAIDKCLIREFRSILVFRFMQFYGTYLGHRNEEKLTNKLKNQFYYPNSLDNKLKDLTKLSAKVINY